MIFGVETIPGILAFLAAVALWSRVMLNLRAFKSRIEGSVSLLFFGGVAWRMFLLSFVPLVAFVWHIMFYPARWQYPLIVWPILLVLAGHALYRMGDTILDRYFRGGFGGAVSVSPGRNAKPL